MTSSTIIPPLDTTTLHRLLSSTHGTHFLGVFALDQLPPRLPNDNQHSYCLIVNTDPSNLPGMHWLAVYIDRNKNFLADVFDSYGRVPPLSLQRWLTKHCRRWTYTRRFIQGALTSLCGIYCIYVLHVKCFRFPKQSFKEIVDSEFGEDASQNDAKMRLFLKSLP